MSEFGRTARKNGSRGADHGHANVMFVMSGAIDGGQSLWRVARPRHVQPYEGRHLALTIDSRSVLGQLAQSHHGNRDLARVFPGCAPLQEK